MMGVMLRISACLNIQAGATHHLLCTQLRLSLGQKAKKFEIPDKWERRDEEGWRSEGGG